MMFVPLTRPVFRPQMLRSDYQPPQRLVGIPSWNGHFPPVLPLDMNPPLPESIQNTKSYSLVCDSEAKEPDVPRKSIRGIILASELQNSHNNSTKSLVSG
jgi:hypothetical protein